MDVLFCMAEIIGNNCEALYNDYYAGYGCGNVVEWLWDDFLLMLLQFHMGSSGCRWWVISYSLCLKALCMEKFACITEAQLKVHLVEEDILKIVVGDIVVMDVMEVHTL